MKKVIIFDVMGVIFTVGDDTNDLLIPYILTIKPQMQEDEIKRLYHEASLGRISAGDFWTGCGFSPDETECVQRTYLDTCLTLDFGFIECAKTLKKKYRLALLSNDVSEWSAYLRKRHNIDDYVDYAFISGDLGLRKPDPRIYESALRVMGVKPSECVFIDDSPERVDAAAELGIASILFNRDRAAYKGLQVTSFDGLCAIL
jgi:putative hydrolase of the HAD superfamily